ncbi:transcription initiation protein [uncultured Bilophila sp.]|uniref:transcription initiation protein n=1 Tax=uncultured Bilophila sp. TaxID=529385 RepID=UPI00280C257B|nr:transcription initiation protein [uncultured Bilophila sp.]
MAIAGITIHTTAEACETVRGRLRASQHVADIQDTGVPSMLAAVLETDAARIEDVLGVLSGWDGVLNVGLVSVSYEDELESKGYIPCPEHKLRKCGPACFGETPNPLG